MTTKEQNEMVEFIKGNQGFIKCFSELFELGFNTHSKLDQVLKLMGKYKNNMSDILPQLIKILEVPAEPDIKYNPYKDFIIKGVAIHE